MKKCKHKQYCLVDDTLQPVWQSGRAVVTTPLTADLEFTPEEPAS